MSPMNRSTPLSLALVFLAGILLRVAGAEPPEPPWSLLPQAQVTGAGVFLDQLVAGADTNAVPHTRLADAPPMGRILQLSSAQVAAALRSAAPAFAARGWSGAPATQVTRRTRALPAAEVLAALKEQLQQAAARDAGELEIRFLRPWSPTVIPDEPYTLRLDNLPPSGLSPILQLRFELTSEQESLGFWQVGLEARLTREVWVARSQLRRGDPVQEADVAREPRDTLRYRDLLPADADFTQGWVVAEPLNPGQPLLRRSLAPRVVVQRGQLLEAVFKEGGLTVSLKVEALDPGAQGQVIRVRNTTSRRELRAKVLNDQAVQIQL
ncbi:MAG TPA: flagella basal body P-ring formation protein FlgA [Verrucomicrobiales bacterium]|nr:flagella basal body P-ring formation protein FlgA [Verrucomicrobiales bacterium]